MWTLNLQIPPLQIPNMQVAMQLLTSFWVQIPTDIPEALLATKLHSEIPTSVCSYGKSAAVCNGISKAFLFYI